MNHRNYTLYNSVKNGVHLSRIAPYYHKFNQPLHSFNNRYSLVLYGEIFSLKGKAVNIDSTVFFLQQVEQNGIDVVKDFNGQFSACLHDWAENVTYLISDRFSTHPLYYSLNNNRLLFATEVKAILKDNFIRKIDHRSISELFSFGHLFGIKTMFKNVNLLAPATVLKFANGQIKESVYWEYPYEEEVYRKQRIDKKQGEELAENLGQILLEATQQQALESNEILVPLSGGLDSRYVAALYHHIGKKDIATFTMGPDESEDQRYGSQVASTLNFSHLKFEIKPQKTWEAAETFAYVSDGMSAISGTLQNFEPFQYFASERKIMAASQMCDAIFGSTLWRKRIRILQENEKPRAITNEILIELFRVLDQNQVKRLFHPHVYKEMEGLYREEPRKYCIDHHHPLDNYYRLLMNEHGRRGTLGGNIVSNLFFKTRMLSYDHQVFDFGWNLSIAYREHQYLYRKTFCQLFPDLARIKRQGYNLEIGVSNWRYEVKMLENKIATLARGSILKNIVRMYKPWNRPSYVSYDRWFRLELQEKVNSFLTRGQLKSSEFIDSNYVCTLLKEHNDGKRNNSALLWQIINLEYFFRNFIAGD